MRRDEALEQGGSGAITRVINLGLTNADVPQGLKSLCENCAVPEGLWIFFPPYPAFRLRLHAGLSCSRPLGGCFYCRLYRTRNPNNSTHADSEALNSTGGDGAGEAVPFQSLFMRRLLLVLVDDVVDDAVFLALLDVHDEVAFHVALDLFQQLAGMLGQYLVSNFAHTQNFAGMDIDVGRLS